MLARMLVVAGCLASVGAHAQTVTNDNTGNTYSTISEALSKGSSGDSYTLDGVFSEAVTVTDDATLVADTNGATISYGQDTLVTVDNNVTLTLEGVDLKATGAVWAIEGLADSNLTVIDAEITAVGAYVDAEGGMVHLENPTAASFQLVTFHGSQGVELSKTGGAIWGTVVGGSAKLHLEDATFLNTEASGNGGAIAANGGLALTCERCIFHHTVGGFGGALFAASTLVVKQSEFCDTSGSLGGAIFGAGKSTVVSSTFLETSAGSGGAIYANNGDWLIRNVHVVAGEITGAGGRTGIVFAPASSDGVEVRNALFLENDGVALSLAQAPSGTTEAEYNWFYGNTGDSDVTLSTTNTTGTAPLLTQWSADGNCTNDDLTPRALTSPLLDAGDPTLSDPDGTRSDIGAFGGPDADGTLYGDGDGDGLGYFWDCDDDDAKVLGETRIFPDCDDDGQGATDSAHLTGCFAPADPPKICGGSGGWALERDLGKLVNADCDDTIPEVFSGAEETCDGLDRNCDGHPYDGAVDMHTYFLDLDRDGFGGIEFQDCGQTVPGWSSAGGDCDDDDPGSYPGAPDLCGDDVDQDCNGMDGERVVSWYADGDGDDFGDRSEVAFEACYPANHPGYVPNRLDCDDQDDTIHPRALELCDGVDRDCDGEIDNASRPRTWYLDGDGDGFGDPLEHVESGCAPGPDWVAEGDDCNDDDPSMIHNCPLDDPGVETQPVLCGCQHGGSLGWAWLGGLLLLVRRRRTGGAR